MKKLLFGVLFSIFASNSDATIYIREIVNNTYEDLMFEYSVPVRYGFDVCGAKRVEYKWEDDGGWCDNYKVDRKNVYATKLMVKAKTRVALVGGTYIPDAKYDPNRVLGSYITIRKAPSNESKSEGFYFDLRQNSLAFLRASNGIPESIIALYDVASPPHFCSNSLVSSSIKEGNVKIEINEISREIYIPYAFGGFQINPKAFSITAKTINYE